MSVGEVADVVSTPPKPSEAGNANLTMHPQGELLPHEAAQPRIDLRRWTSYHRLRNGTGICIRPLRSFDREREIAFIQSLSERIRYLRMMAPLRYVSPHLLEQQLLTVDYHNSMALAATVDEDEAERFIALVRYGATAEPTTVEFAITVMEVWQRQGVARLLIEKLMEYASLQGMHTVIGWVLYENTPMLELAKACGFRARIDTGHGSLQITRTLGLAQSADAGAASRTL